MTHTFDELHVTIKRLAADRGLIIVNDVPILSRFPNIVWQGSWEEYLDCAVQVQATVLYLRKWIYDPDLVINIAIAENEDHIDDEDEDDLEEAEVALGDTRWLIARLKEAIAPWAKYTSNVFGISCIWIKEGIAHYWSKDVEWYSEHNLALETAIENAKQVMREQRVLRSDTDAIKFHEYATKIAHHPRFPEATSDAKRQFMVEQVFPEINDVFPGYNSALQLVQRANLIYWWDVEPNEKVKLTERVKQMYEDGETIRNIAAILKISEAKVRAAVRNNSET